MQTHSTEGCSERARVHAQCVYQHSLTCKTSSISKNVPTELRDAANTGSQQGLFQRPQLQLGVRVLSAVHRGLLVLCVRAEVGRQRQNTYGDRNQRTR